MPNIDLPDEINQIVTKFTDQGYQIYLVGGAVRDLLLKQPLKDYDFTTDATPEQILELLPDGYNNNQFGTVGLQLGEHLLEITTMRTEGEYHDSRHPDQVNWTHQIAEDLKRRDFTINSMALDLKSQELIDPFDGQTDLQNHLIRAVGDPDKRFQEDALRLLRAVRFSCQLQFQIEPRTLDSLSHNAHLLTQISWERIRDEFLKILATNYPYEGVLLLHDTNLLKYIIPELERCFGVVQEGPKHDRIYDIGQHSLLALKFCPSPDPIVRLAALIHDIGKADTYRVDDTGNVTFYHHEVVGAKIAKQICTRLHLSNKQTDLVITLVRWHMFSVDEHQTDSAIRRIIKNIGVDNLDQMFAIREADRLGGGTASPTSWRLERFKERTKEVLIKPFSITDLKINGTDVMETLNLPPSRQIGDLLQQLFVEVQADAEKNNREYLLKRLPELVS